MGGHSTDPNLDHIHFYLHTPMHNHPATLVGGTFQDSRNMCEPGVFSRCESCHVVNVSVYIMGIITKGFKGPPTPYENSTPIRDYEVGPFWADSGLHDDRSSVALCARR